MNAKYLSDYRLSHQYFIMQQHMRQEISTHVSLPAESSLIYARKGKEILRGSEGKTARQIYLHRVCFQFMKYLI